MSTVKILNPIESKVSLTIGNPEIVNMLVQRRVKAIRAELKNLRRKNIEHFEMAKAKVVGIIASLKSDFQAAHGKKLDAYAKARSALVGRKLKWLSPYPETPSDNDIMQIGSNYIMSYRSPHTRDQLWGTPVHEKELVNKVETIVYFSEIPTSKELDDWDSNWRQEFDSKEFAIEAWAQDNLEDNEFYLSFVRSDKTIELIKECREFDNAGAPIRMRIAELDNLLDNTPDIEKAVLAQMTENTLESNPELASAFGVLAKGLLGMEESPLMLGQEEIDAD
jgi:hypothetical protein